MPKSTLKCLWCGRLLRPKYERQCADCHHPEYQHPQKTAAVQRCHAQDCACTRQVNVYIYGSDNQEKREAALVAQKEQFPKVLVGYGQMHAGKFDTQMCGLRWANKYAKG